MEEEEEEMGMLVLAVLFSLVVGGAIWILPNLKKRGSKYVVDRPGKAHFLLAFLVTVFVFAVLAMTSSYTPVQFGTVAVVTRFGGVVDYNPETGTGKVLEPGLRWKWPFIERVEVYHTRKMLFTATNEAQVGIADSSDIGVNTTTKDGQRITVNYTVLFRNDPDRVAWIANNLGSEARVIESIVRNDSRILASNTAKQFLALELYTGDIVLYQKAVAEPLSLIFADNGLILDEFGARDGISFESGYVTTIEEKQIEFEKITTAGYQAQQEVHRKQQTITEAEGQAESIRIRGEALRENPEILQLELINKLGPNIRVILLPSGQQFILGGDVLGDLTSGGESPSGGPTP